MSSPSTCRGLREAQIVPAPDSLSGYAGTVFALMDDLGIGRFSMVGFSMGGMIALQAALDQPDRIGS